MEVLFYVLYWRYVLKSSYDLFGYGQPRHLQHNFALLCIHLKRISRKYKQLLACRDVRFLRQQFVLCSGRWWKAKVNISRLFLWLIWAASQFALFFKSYFKTSGGWCIPGETIKHHWDRGRLTISCFDLGGGGGGGMLTPLLRMFSIHLHCELEFHSRRSASPWDDGLQRGTSSKSHTFLSLCQNTEKIN